MSGNAARRPGTPPDECAFCRYDFRGLTFSRTTDCPECGRPASAAIVAGMRRHEELACAIGWVGGVLLFGVFLLSTPLGYDEDWWWGVCMPLTVVVIGTGVCGINYLNLPETRYRRLALCLAIVPVIAWAGLVALVIRDVLA